MNVNGYSWYKVINKAEFEAADIPSRELSLSLGGIGQADVMVVKGELVSIVYDGVMLTPGLNDRNPFEFDGYAAGLDDQGDIYLGVPIT